MPSNVLPFYVTAETGSVECPGFAAFFASAKSAFILSEGANGRFLGLLMWFSPNTVISKISMIIVA